MSGEKVYRSIGLMSGTALDGEIDVALIETDGRDYVRALDFYTHPYDVSVRDKVRACFGKRARDSAVDEAEFLVTELHIAAVKASGFEAEVIGFHGQTITHAPEDRFTWQLGDGARLAQETGVMVVSDMRQADVQAGGQGAPLLPLYHRARLFSDVSAHKKPLVVLNFGGVSNITYIGADGALTAFDCGPGNALMDDFMKRRTGKAFDLDGALAALGDPDGRIVEAFLSDSFFSKPAPKSLDRNEWSIDLMDGLSDEDGMATLLVLSVGALERAEKLLPSKPKIYYVAGGGRHNKTLMTVLNNRLGSFWNWGASVKPVEALGWNGDATEAEGFAYLAVRSLLDLPLSLPETTGVPKALSGGVIHRVL